MKYVLTPAQINFRESVRQFAKGINEPGALRPAPENEESSALARRIEEGIMTVSNGVAEESHSELSCVAAVVALEEVLRQVPTSDPELAAGGIFRNLSAELCRAVSAVGVAQGLLAPFLRDLENGRIEALNGGAENRSKAMSWGNSGSYIQALSDLVAEIECARLFLYRAAILEEEKKQDHQESAKAENLARELASRAAVLAEQIMKGRNYEA